VVLSCEATIHFDYPIVFTEHAFAADNSSLAKVIARAEPDRVHRVLVIMERAVAEAHPRLAVDIYAWAAANPRHIALAREVLIDEGGEVAKSSMVRPLKIAAELDAARMDRQSVVMIVGGGAFLDMVGFAAAITHRGVRVVRVPSTVLSQADSAVGVKNGINAFGKKNFLGTFAAPFAVVNDAALLGTLPPRDRVAGMAEAVKVALVRDGAFFEWITKKTRALAANDRSAVGELIERSAELHARHIATSGDPFELGSARPLDFGHWAAHKLESLSEYDVRHGEGVAIGIALDTYYSVEAGKLPRPALETVIHTLSALGLPLWHDRMEDPALLDGIREFQEHLGGDLTVTLLADLGRGYEAHALETSVVKSGIEWLKTRAR